MEGEGKGEPPDWMSDPGPIVSPVDAGEQDTFGTFLASECALMNILY